MATYLMGAKMAARALRLGIDEMGGIANDVTKEFPLLSQKAQDLVTGTTPAPVGGYKKRKRKSKRKTKRKPRKTKRTQKRKSKKTKRNKKINKRKSRK